MRDVHYYLYISLLFVIYLRVTFRRCEGSFRSSPRQKENKKMPLKDLSESNLKQPFIRAIKRFREEDHTVRYDLTLLFIHYIHDLNFLAFDLYNI